MNIVCFSAIGWDFLFQRAQHIVSGLSENGLSVIYINPPNNLPRDVAIRKPAVQYFTDLVYYVRVGILRKKAVINRRLLIFNPVNYFGPRRKLQLMILHLNMLFIRILGILYFRSSEVDVWLFFEPYYSSFILPLIKNGKIVYDCADESSGFSNVSPDIAKAEENLIKKSSLVIATSRKLVQKIGKTAQDCFYVPNAVDFRHFHSATQIKKRPKELEGLKNPTIGFIGAIYDWIDTSLICKLAEVHPDYSVLLVGPIHSGQNELKKHSNITMVGTKKYEFLPQYLAFMDVCLIPFKLNKLTLASNPIKMYEYLAAGKPVVSTALPEVQDNASHVVMIGRDHQDFIKKVEDAVNASPKEEESARLERIKFAKDNSWDKRVRLIKELLENL